jgi:hypothetical protein
VYDSYADAVTVVTDLEAAPDLASNRQISVIANESRRCGFCRGLRGPIVLAFTFTACID